MPWHQRWEMMSESIWAGQPEFFTGLCYGRESANSKHRFGASEPREAMSLRPISVTSPVTWGACVPWLQILLEVEPLCHPPEVGDTHSGATWSTGASGSRVLCLGECGVLPFLHSPIQTPWLDDSTSIKESKQERDPDWKCCVCLL